EPLQRWIEEQNATEYIQLLGTRSDIPALLAQMSVFVLSSRSEGMPLAVLEAMSAQRPIIATAVGEVPALLENGACGVLVPPEAPERLACEIIRMVQEPERALQIAAKARQKYLQHYTVETMVSRYIQIYHAVLRMQQ
ncbi:MAG: glycosyltransferase, partial [Fimbriimonadales bacterium]|nr:glycosyltransferase [Fimbriimonadales bacterium]